MSYSLILAFLLAFSLLPPAYIRYVPFQTIVTPHTKRILIGMYMCIFLCEFLGMNAAFYTAALAPTWMFCKFFLMFAWIPYVLVNLCIIRSYIPQHIFILGMQSIYMISMHTLSMNIVLSWVPAAQFDAYIVVHEVLYIALFILFLPIIRWFFLKIFFSIISSIAALICSSVKSSFGSSMLSVTFFPILFLKVITSLLFSAISSPPKSKIIDFLTKIVI